MRKIIIPNAAFLFFFCISVSSNSQITQIYTVTNNSGIDLKGFSISPAGTNSWTKNLAYGTSVKKNEIVRFSAKVSKNSCLYDLRYKDEDGIYHYMEGIDLCANTSVSLVSPDNLTKQSDEKNEQSDSSNTKKN